MIERIGQGIDIHAFAKPDVPHEQSRPLKIGGVIIPDAPRVIGHSDADVVYHAIVDAILGAFAKGDIGTLVGVDKPETQGADSSEFVLKALHEIAGWRVVNLDCTIIAQTPRVAEHVPQMRQHVATLLRLNLPDVSIKATTTDRLGFIGNKEGLAATCIAGFAPSLPWDDRPRELRPHKTMDVPWDTARNS